MATPEPDPTVADTPPKAFVSYSWDDPAHKEWVRQLATQLRADGVDVTLDHWHSAPGDQIPAFMERAVRENDFVIAVCTPRFKERSDGRGGGVGYEGDIMTAYAFTSGAEKKFIPVLRRGKWIEAAPTWLLGRAMIDLSGDPYSESEYDELLRTLHGAREEAPPIGRRPNFGDNKKSKGRPGPEPVTSHAGSSTHHHQSSITPLRIFLSSTFADLEAERKAVEAGIQRMAARFIGMEHFGSFLSVPLEKCLEYIRSADTVVLLLGGRYGSVSEDSSVAMTEAEYTEAIRNSIPVLPYLQETQETIWSPPSERSQADTRLIALREELKAKHRVTWFSTPEDLAWKVASDLAREFAHLLRQDAPPAEEIPDAILADPLRDRINELVEVLNQRAEKIRCQLQKHFRYVAVKDYICKFNELHQKHIDSLRNGKMILAHEILLEIHELSFELSHNEFWERHRIETPGHMYRISIGAFTRGPLVCEYIVDDMCNCYDKYDIYDGYTESWSDSKPSPATILTVYRKVLATK
jgi:hypothetical protein